MIHNIASNIEQLAVDIDLLKPLENNARRGNVDAIMASYNKFGQVKPIVAVQDSAANKMRGLEADTAVNGSKCVCG